MASLDAVVELISGRFRRAEPRRQVGTYLRGLLAGLERKNGWTLAGACRGGVAGRDAAAAADRGLGCGRCP